MTAYQIIFYLIAASILISGLLAVTSPKIFRSAIYLLFSLLGVAGLYFWMEVNFIAAVQIVVYAGGISVLIIFSIFLTEQSGKKTKNAPALQTVSALLAALFGLILTYLVISKYAFKNSGEAFDPSVRKIGDAMMNFENGGFSLPFEVVSILLLAAMVGCIVVAMKSGIALQENGQPQQKQENE